MKAKLFGFVLLQSSGMQTLRQLHACQVSAVCSMSRLAFGSSQVQFTGPAHSFIGRQLLVEG